ncbi:MAG: cobalt-precorrin-5B (C(1))-methyltransferase CbiD [Thermodesulfobacteriota bacterium]
MSQKQTLRTGFTTGSAAAAGAKAATLLLGGQKTPQEVDIPLPGGDRLHIPIVECCADNGQASCTVIKDGGDDPDATHMARITATIIHHAQDAAAEQVTILGGTGVGVVTKPGLPVPVGQAAINPVPREQIRQAVTEALLSAGLSGPLQVTISVANGEKIAQKTFNPRLGILGGISILGTRGTVRPYSHQAYKDTITACLDAAQAQSVSWVGLCTGGRSERYLRQLHPELPQTACILVADFLAFSLQEAVQRHFARITYACFFGKLVKAALGHAYTHAKECSIDFHTLASWVREAGLSQTQTKEIQACNTARQALDIIRTTQEPQPVIRSVASRALSSLEGFAHRTQGIDLAVFDDQGEMVIEL